MTCTLTIVLQVVGVSLDIYSLNSEDLVVLRLQTCGIHLVDAQSASKSGVSLIQDHGRVDVLCATSLASKPETSEIYTRT